MNVGLSSFQCNNCIVRALGGMSLMGGSTGGELKQGGKKGDGMK